MAIRSNAYHVSDGSSINFTTYIDRDGAIVGVDTYQIWGYPKDTSGTIIDYAPLVRYNYVRADSTLTVEFPRTSKSFQVGGQDWMSAWTSYTPVVTGTG